MRKNSTASPAVFVALLRGVNVGGKNMISMAALKTSFEKSGFTRVSTYINSGSILFSTKKPTRASSKEQSSSCYRQNINSTAKLWCEVFMKWLAWLRICQRNGIATRTGSTTSCFSGTQPQRHKVTKQERASPHFTDLVS